MIKVSDSELEVMKILWDAKKAVPTNEIAKELQAGKGWDRSTVRTLLARLVEKGGIERVQEDVYYYRPIIDEDAYISAETKGFIDKLYSGSVKKLVATLVNNEGLSQEEINELKSFFREGR